MLSFSLSKSKIQVPSTERVPSLAQRVAYLRYLINLRLFNWRVPALIKIHLEEPRKTNLEPWKPIKTDLDPWKTNLNPWKPIKADMEPWKSNLEFWKPWKLTWSCTGWLRVVTGGYRSLPGGSDDFSWHTNRQTLHHNIYIIINLMITTAPRCRPCCPTEGARARCLPRPRTNRQRSSPRGRCWSWWWCSPRGRRTPRTPVFDTALGRTYPDCPLLQTGLSEATIARKHAWNVAIQKHILSS